MLVINNVNDRPKGEKEAQKAVDKGVITSYVFVEDHINDALASFKISKESLGEDTIILTTNW